MELRGSSALIQHSRVEEQRLADLDRRQKSAMLKGAGIGLVTGLAAGGIRAATGGPPASIVGGGLLGPLVAAGAVAAASQRHPDGSWDPSLLAVSSVIGGGFGLPMGAYAFGGAAQELGKPAGAAVAHGLAGGLLLSATFAAGTALLLGLVSPDM